ncbi:MAG: tRNA (guanine-N(1)-)-methyltransferase [uncultured bacterium]|nr:MAG: tRNA (guanine-N(1)-)-methyltransferase [uncultured bacterium]
MEYHILTLIPEALKPYFESSILGKAQKEGVISLFFHQMRDYAQNKHKSVDDGVYGGGAGMVIRPEVIVAAVKDIKARYPAIEKVILLSPRGLVFAYPKARELSTYKGILFICGRYEGVDQRAIDLVVDEEVSIGDYVLTGGELAAAVVIDAVARLIPDVVGNIDGPSEDSFVNGLLEYPHYTRPAVFENSSVPDVLLKGNHSEIARWRHLQSSEITQARRPDLWQKFEAKIKK